MKYDRPRNSDSPDQRSKVLPFQRHDKTHRRCSAANAERNIEQLLDLSRYENQNRNTDEFRTRMVENVAAMLFLSALVAVGAFDLIGLQQIQHCALPGGC